MELQRYAVVFVLLLAAHVRSGAHIPIKLGLYANKVVSYGVETPLVVTMSKYPDCKLVLRVSSSSYLVANWIVDSETGLTEPQFKMSDNIMGELSRLNIVPSVHVSYNVGYFAELNATFWQQSNVELTVKAWCSLKSRSNPADKSIQLTMNISTACIPNMATDPCFNPLTPIEFSVRSNFAIEMSFKTNCGISNPQLIWTVMDLMETKKLIAFSTQTLELYLSPYVLRFPTEPGLNSNQYVMQISGVFEGRKFVARCYIKALAEEVEAIISGGRLKEVVSSQAIYMDASSSRDYSKRPEEKQFNEYNWICQTSDIRNAMCNGRSWNEEKFRIPGGSYAVGNNYEFTLTVVSDTNPDQRAHATQLISIVSHNTLKVAIKCVSNCESNLYEPEKEVRLSVECYNCRGQQPKYNWFLEGYPSGGTKDLNLHVRTETAIANVSLRVRTSDFRTGYTEHILRERIIGRSRGRCYSRPVIGDEAITLFRACCYGFQSYNSPFRYYYYARQVMLNECFGCGCPLILPAHINTIWVNICDAANVCTTGKFRVRMKPMRDIPEDTPEAVWKFITTPPYDFNVYDDLRFMAVMQSVANVIRKPLTYHTFMKALEHFEPESLCTLGRLANFTMTMAVNMSPINHTDLVVLVNALTILNKNFQVVKDDEYAKFLTRRPFANMTLDLIKVNNLMDHINSHILGPTASILDQYKTALRNNSLDQALIDKLIDEINHYAHKKIRWRSMNWLVSMWQTERLRRYLKFARLFGFATNDTGGVDVEKVSLYVKCMFYKPDLTYLVETDDLMHSVFFSTQLLHEIRDPRTGKLCIEVTSVIRKLDWWYPVEKQPSSVLLSVRVNGQSMDYAKEYKLYKSRIRFETRIGKLKPVLSTEFSQISRQMILR
ncbi:uncharacterized protein LOC111603854 isoform X2 [Drosophila hydei]|uniref:Uncharacterized protein LOC111603854 isoform X2 n=1 Tax=Drosophila hydei TaxID=7224 RepID=A0A6J1MAJ9_DROHY|nr:uncharacterized protein LOC111603854 isoform X2 [Drosophila hydei]